MPDPFEAEHKRMVKWWVLAVAVFIVIIVWHQSHPENPANYHPAGCHAAWNSSSC